MIEVENLTYRIAGRTLIEGASARLAEGQRVGLIGRNGTGKSTLLKLIAGLLEPDAGTIRQPKEMNLGMVAQEAPGGPETPIEIVLAGHKELADLTAASETETDPDKISEIHMRLADIGAYDAEARAGVILAGLGFDATAQRQPMSSFSGGWRMRVALAAALFPEPDLLLLDEPTNHLDLEAALWLEGFLAAYPRGLLMVSHDRDFLDTVATNILHLDNGKLVLYSGGYTSFERVRRERAAQTAAAITKQEAARAHMQAFVDRFRAKASKARQAQSRLKALAKLEPLAAAVRDPDVRFDLPEPDELAPPMIALDRVDVGYIPGKPILRNLDLRIDPDDRIALLGSNGNGKSTLAKLIGGRLAPQAGERHASGRLRVGYFAQHQVDELDLDQDPIQLMTRQMPGATPQAVRARLGRFGFGQDRAQTKAGSLSGGEKARLTLALVTAHVPHLLILDEPTNHLDIESRDALIESLAAFTGAVVLVSHDRHLVELTADRLWLVEDGTASPFEGDMDEYRRRVLSRGPGERSAARAREAKADRAVSAPARPKGNPNQLRKAVKDLEAQMAKLTADKTRLEGELANPKVYSGPRDKLERLTREQSMTVKALDEAEQKWLELSEHLNAVEA